MESSETQANQSAAEVNSTGYKKPAKTQEEKDKFAAYQRGRRAALKAGTWAPGRRSKGAAAIVNGGDDAVQA